MNCDGTVDAIDSGSDGSVTLIESACRQVSIQPCCPRVPEEAPEDDPFVWGGEDPAGSIMPPPLSGGGTTPGPLDPQVPSIGRGYLEPNDPTDPGPGGVTVVVGYFPGGLFEH